jgi:hypothetical protein
MFKNVNKSKQNDGNIRGLWLEAFSVLFLYITANFV